jgi:sulfocyanin
MKRISALGTTPLLLALIACGGGDSGDSESAPASESAEPAPAAAPAAEPAAPVAADWFQIDEGAMTVTLDITAGATTDNNSWNFNGAYNGSATVTVPEGYTVTVNFTNQDPNMAHSVGVDARTGNFPPNISDPTPVFAGAISANPTSLTEATMPGDSESFTFTADAAGEYTLVCYIPGHAVTGMWIYFNVSSDGSSGVTM